MLKTVLSCLLSFECNEYSRVVEPGQWGSLELNRFYKQLQGVDLLRKKKDIWLEGTEA